VRRPEGKRPRGEPRRRRQNNIKVDLKEVICKVVDWIYLVQEKER
jgi:hypothetical protein